MNKRNITTVVNFFAGVAAMVLLGWLLISLWGKSYTVGGPDFLYYLLNGRSWALKNFPMNYGYFPGVQLFWGAIISKIGSDFLALQKVYVLVIFASVMVFGLNIYSITKNWISSALFCSVYIAALLVLEGMGGVLETFAILILMTGYLLYSWAISGKYYFSGFLTLIIFLGITVFTKQQGLVFVVASFLLPFDKLKSGWDFRFKNFLVLLLPLLCVYILFLISGSGLAGIKSGLGLLHTYGSEGSFLTNLKPAFLSLQFLIAFYFLIIFLTGILFLGNDGNQLSKEDFRKVLFWAAGLVGFIFQFKARGYLHYGIYFIPGILISIAIGWSSLISLGKTKLRTDYFEPVSTMFLSILVVGLLMSWPEFKYSFANISEPKVLIEISEIKNACDNLISDKVILLPPRGNAFHWSCGTVPFEEKYGFSWAQESAQYYYELLKDPRAKQVFLFNSEFGPFEREILSRPDWGNVTVVLEQQGFIATFENSIGKLYQRF